MLHALVYKDNGLSRCPVGRTLGFYTELPRCSNEMEEGSISKPNLSPTAWQCLFLRSPAEEVEERCLRDCEVLQQHVRTPTPPGVVCSTFSHPTESKPAAFTVHRRCGAGKSSDLRTRIQDCRSKSLGKSMSTTRAGALSNTKASRSTHSSTKRASNVRHSR
jgi:hypothetical protein